MNQSCNMQISLQLSRPTFALTVDLELPASGVSVLFGSSGSGKTTLLRCLAGLERAVGRVSVNGDVWQDSSRNYFKPVWQRDLGYVFQEASLFEHLNVRKNLEFGIKRVKKPGLTHTLTQAIDLLGISHLLDRDVGHLSGGERQRVAIARALATQPSLLLLDEPLASLDYARRQEILPWLEELHRELAIPVVYVTHSMHELTRLADHVVLLDNGRVIVHGEVTNVLSDPTFSRYVAADAGAIVEGVVVEQDPHYCLTGIALGSNRLWVGQVDLPIGVTVRLHVHANDVSLALSEPQDSSIQNCLQGRVVRIDDDLNLAHALVSVDCNGRILLARVTRRALDGLQLAPGHLVWCQIKSVALAGR